jgi:23S rRNA pseudouridine1911/1915/1917 synthase
MAEPEKPQGALSWHWTPASADARLDRAITEALERGEGVWSPTESPRRLSRSRIQKLIEAGSVRVAGAPARSSDPVAAGTPIELELETPRSLELTPEERPLDILFQDEHLAVLNKQPGLTVHPSETQSEGTLVHALLHHLSDLSGIGGVLRPGIVHRIDKDTSGVLVVTKTDSAHRALSELFSRHDLERRYWALCYGSPGLRPGEEKRVESQIGRSPSDRKKMAMEVPGGKRAVTFFRERETYFAPPPGRVAPAPFASCVEARLETGRTHQVRVHLTGLGHSLLGDPVYGTPSERHPKWLSLPPPIRELVRALPGQALHARLLAFRHPISGEELRFEAEPPPVFAALLAELRKHQPPPHFPPEPRKGL